jgi:anthranilate synthase component 1
MLVDLGRNDLGRVSAPGSVVLDRYMEVERFSHVMHLTSHISAQLSPGLDAIDVLRAVFPAGTVSGAPKIRAMELLAEEEQGPRGPYAGAVGWFGLDGQGIHMDTGITIRSLWIRDGRAFWQAGGGVVHDSSPEAEWKEIVNKAAAVQAALTGNATGEPRPPRNTSSGTFSDNQFATATGEPCPPRNTPDRSGQHPDTSLAGTGAGGRNVSAH